MVAIAASLVAKVATEGVEEASRQLGEVGKKANETKGHFEGLKNALSTAAGFAIFGGVMAGVGLFKDQIGSVIELTKEFQQTQAQTNQVLKSTHDVSGMTKESLEGLAQAYGKTTMFSADTVQQGENLLLTFTNIGHNVFPQATQAILDVSQAMGQDLKSSAIQVGKALGDPLHGFANLQRIGVTFSEEEKKQIKTMMSHNDIIGAQKIILHELSTEFGGSALAAGKTFGGQMEILKNQFDEIKIKIGGALLPVLSDLMNKYVVPLAARFQDWMNKGGGLQDFKIWIQDASNFLQGQLIPQLNTMLNQYIEPLAGWMYTTFVNSGFLKTVWDDTNNVLSKLLPQLGGMVSNVGHFLDFLTKSNPQAAIMRDILGGIAGIVAAQKIGGMVKDFADLGSKMADIVANSGKNMLAFLTGGNGLDTAAGSADKAMVSLGTDSQVTGGEIATAGNEAATAGGEIEGLGTDAEVAAPKISGLGTALSGVLGLASQFAGLSLLGVSFGGSQGAQAVQSQLNKSASLGTNKSWLQYEWEKIHGFNNFGAMPNFNNMTPAQQNQIMSDWYAHNSGAFPWSQVQAHASGILNNPVGHWATVGEQGSETMYVPAGASILPHGMSPSALGGGQNIHVDVYLDGERMGQKLMGPIVNQIRYNVGSIGF